MKNILDFEVLEWSETQKCFHVHTVKEMLRDNRRNASTGSRTDYIPVAIAETYEDLQIIKETQFQHLIDRHVTYEIDPIVTGGGSK